jgi:hypothetical protein
MDDNRRDGSTACIFSPHVDRAPYPSVNWWPGKLRPFESLMSFAARFCALNGITIWELESFLGHRLDNGSCFTQDDLCRIASLLSENLSLVETVFVQTIQLSDCGQYGLPCIEHSSEEIHYCQRCAEFGYHSYLHDAPWLARCPFHFTSLKTYSNSDYKDTIFSRKIDSLSRLMMANCRAWPRSDEGDFEIFKFERNVCLQLLSAWTKNVRATAIELSQGQFWDCDEQDRFETKSYKPGIGRLRKLEHMPALIEPLFTTVGEAWQLETRRFPLETKFQLHRLRKYARFWRIFNFYKNVAARANNPPPFIAKLRATQMALKERHGKCRCRWGREKAGWWGYHWIKTHPEEWPYLNLKCPYDVALEDLELAWGHPDRVLSSRLAEAERSRFLRECGIMHDAGLIEYTSNANISPEGYLYAVPQVWPCCEWKETSSLTELLNTAAEFEIDSASIEIDKWLDAIDVGSTPPSEWKTITGCVRLCETEEGLLLIKWTPEEKIQR